MTDTLGFSFIIGQKFPATLALINVPKFLPEGMSRFLFESHWFIWVVLALVGIILLVAARRGQTKLQPAASGVLIALAVWILLAWTVDTRYERLYASSRRLLDATIQQNADGVLAELDDDFAFGDIKKTKLGEMLHGTLAALAISKHSIVLFDEAPGDPDTLVHINILSTLGKDMSLPTEWELLYKEEPDGTFKLHSVAGWKINGEPQRLEIPQIPGFDAFLH